MKFEVIKEMDHYGRRNALPNPHWKGDGINALWDLPCATVPVKALNIIWGNDPRFWQWIKLSTEDERLTGFQEAVVLVQVNWIEVTGKIPVHALPSTRNKIYYVVKFQTDAFGWHSVPIKFKVRQNGQETVLSVLLESYRQKQGVWHEIYGGEFTVSKEDRDGVVEFGMFEVESDWWKGSMVLAGIKIRPEADDCGLSIV